MKPEIHSSLIPYIIVNAATLMIMDANEAACKLLEYSKTALLKLHVFKLVHQPLVKKAEENAALFRNQKIYAGSNRYITKKGNIIPVRILAQRISFRNKSCWQVKITVEPEKKAGERLKDE